MIHVQDSVAYMNHTVVVTICADADNNTMACRGIVCSVNMPKISLAEITSVGWEWPTPTPCLSQSLSPTE